MSDASTLCSDVLLLCLVVFILPVCYGLYIFSIFFNSFQKTVLHYKWKTHVSSDHRLNIQRRTIVRLTSSADVSPCAGLTTTYVASAGVWP